MKIKKITEAIVSKFVGNRITKNLRTNSPYYSPLRTYHSRGANRNLHHINSIIQKTYCPQTDRLLSDDNLMNQFIVSKSSQRKINTLKSRLENLNLSKSHVKSILNDNLILNEFCVAPGTKGVIRGNTFNKIVKDKVLDIGNNLNSINENESDFEIEFEKKIGIYTHEIPDWYILQKSTGKIIIGMNQIDLWSGGQQTNRGSKYILNDDFHKELII